MKTPARKLQNILTPREKHLLRGRSWRAVTFRNVDFSKSDFRGASFERVVFLRCSLEQADLRGAACMYCRFVACDFDAAAFGRNRFEGSVFRNCRSLSPDRAPLITSHGGRVLDSPAG